MRLLPPYDSRLAKASDQSGLPGVAAAGCGLPTPDTSIKRGVTSHVGIWHRSWVKDESRSRDEAGRRRQLTLRQPLKFTILCIHT